MAFAFNVADPTALAAWYVQHLGMRVVRSIALCILARGHVLLEGDVGVGKTTVAAALALGADGVWIGTRFIATPEARAVPGYKDALLRIGEDGTVISRGYTGKTCRVVRNDYTQYWEEHPADLQPFPAQFMRSMEDGANHLGLDENATDIDADKEFWPAGQGVGAIDELVPAGELVGRLMAEAESALDRVAGLR